MQMIQKLLEWLQTKKRSQKQLDKNLLTSFSGISLNERVSKTQRDKLSEQAKILCILFGEAADNFSDYRLTRNQEDSCDYEHTVKEIEAGWKKLLRLISETEETDLIEIHKNIGHFTKKQILDMHTTNMRNSLRWLKSDKEDMDKGMDPYAVRGCGLVTSPRQFARQQCRYIDCFLPDEYKPAPSQWLLD